MTGCRWTDGREGKGRVRKRVDGFEGGGPERRWMNPSLALGDLEDSWRLRVWINFEDENEFRNLFK